MNYKKIFWVLVLTTIVAAQKSGTFNVFGGVGFGIATGGQLFSSMRTSINDTLEEEDSYFNFGRGLKLDLGMQYFLMDNIALQAGMGISGNAPRLETFNETPVSKINTTYRSSLWGLKALIVPHFEVLELITMYTGVGVGFFWNSWKYEKDIEIEIAGVTTKRTVEGKIKTNPKLALLGLAGVDYPISDLLTAYGEVAFEQMSFTTKKSVEDNQTTVYEKDSDLEAPQRVPGSNWQIRFGMRFNLR